MSYVQARFKVGDDVAFTKMCQPGLPPFDIQEVDANMFDVRYKVNDKWWHEGNLMPYSEWRRH